MFDFLGHSFVYVMNFTSGQQLGLLIAFGYILQLYVKYTFFGLIT